MVNQGVLPCDAAVRLPQAPKQARRYRPPQTRQAHSHLPPTERRGLPKPTWKRPTPISIIINRCRLPFRLDDLLGIGMSADVPVRASEPSR